MQEADIAAKNYFSIRERTADLLNYQLFHGAPVIRPEYLSRQDADISTLDKNHIGHKRERDQVWLVQTPDSSFLVGIEHQTYVHYFMPFRQFNYESHQYMLQYQQAKAKHHPGRNVSGDEYLSGISAGEKILPVISLTVYWNWRQRWDGKKSTKELLLMQNLKKEVAERVTDYRMDLLEVGQVQDLESFQTDLKLVIGFLQNADNLKGLQIFLKKYQEDFQNLAADAYELISVLAGERKRKLLKTVRDREENCDMCKALDDLWEDGVKTGVERGRKIGEKYGEKRGRKIGEEKAVRLFQLLLEQGRQDLLLKAAKNEQFRQGLYQEFHIVQHGQTDDML